MATIFSWFVLILLLPFVSGDPIGCTYDASQILYSCNARSWSLPLVFSTFTTAQPQRLMLKDVDGEISSVAPNGPAFSGFSSINTGTFDPDYAPALYIMCYFGGKLILDRNAFRDFGYVEEVKITNCDILSLPVQVFSYFADVNLFQIEGGSISNMVADSFKGLNVNRMTTVPNPLGEFAIKNSKLTSRAMAFGALFNMPNAERVLIEKADLATIQSDIFYALTKLNYVSLNNNAFTSIPNNMFANMRALSSIDMYGINWACSCGNLWFLNYVSENNITMNGDIVCYSPVDSQNKRAKKYYQDTCASGNVCGKVVGVAVGSRCISVFEFVNYVLLLITLAISCVALGLIVHTKRQVTDTIEPTKNLGLLGEKKISASSMNKISAETPRASTSTEPDAPPLPQKSASGDDIETEA